MILMIWATLLAMAFVFLGTSIYFKDRSFLIYTNIYAAASLLAVGMIE